MPPLAGATTASRGSRRGPASSAAAPTGTFTRNTEGQPSAWVSTPPKSSPAAPPTGAAAVQKPSARVRSGPCGKVVVTSASAAGVASAAPAPWSARAAISAPGLAASPQASDPPVNTAMPARKMRRRPAMSASRPATSSSPPNAST